MTLTTPPRQSRVGTVMKPCLRWSPGSTQSLRISRVLIGACLLMSSQLGFGAPGLA